MGYGYEIIYRPGKENSVADALSRMQWNLMLHRIFTSQVTLWDEIKKAIAADPYIQSMGHVATEKLGRSYIWRQ